MRTLQIIATALFLLFIGAEARGQEEIEDLIWLKQTDQGAGFYQVKFSENGHLIAGHGLSDVLFFDSETGEEIIRIPGNEEVHFFNNDENFLRLNEDKITIEIFDTASFQVVDSLESDGDNIGYLDISEDQTKVVGVIHRGLKTWDLNSKNILNTLKFEDKENLTDVGVKRPYFLCDDNQIIGQFYETFVNFDTPKEPETYTIASIIIWDFNTLDSIDSFENSTTFRVSNNCEYLAQRYFHGGINILNYQTKELIHSLPINGMSVTGYEFSPDDNYLVTTQGSGANPGNIMIIWDMQTGEEVHRYTIAGYSNLDISPNGLYIVVSVGRQLALFNSRFDTSPVDEFDELDHKPFPNPSNDILNIELETNIQDIQSIQFLNSTGKLVEEYSIDKAVKSDGSLILDTSGLASGAYIAIIQAKTKNYSYKFIKK